MKSAKATHKSMGKKGGVSAGLESGVAETMSIDRKPASHEVGDTGRVKPQPNGSVAAK